LSEVFVFKPRDDKPLALSFQRRRMTHPISILAYWSSLSEGSARELSCWYWILFSWPSGPSKILSRLDTSANWLPPWACLTPANLSLRLRLGHDGASVVVHRLWCLISSGNTTSTPNSNLNGVKLVALQTVVLWLHTTLGMTPYNSLFLAEHRTRNLLPYWAPLGTPENWVETFLWDVAKSRCTLRGVWSTSLLRRPREKWWVIWQRWFHLLRLRLWQLYSTWEIYEDRCIHDIWVELWLVNLWVMVWVVGG
jgi:hypothetical protein